jgi:Fe-S cluster assembly protein SufD
MISAEQQSSWFEDHLQSATNLPGQDIDWLSDARKSAVHAVKKLPIMDRKSEAWRYSHVEALLEERFVSAVEPASDGKTADLPDGTLPSLNACRLVFVNGSCVSGSTVLDDVPQGVYAGSLREAVLASPEHLSVWFGKVAGQESNPFTALNTALADDGLFLHIASGIELDKPIEVIYFGSHREQAQMVQLRNLIVLEPGAKATLVEHFIGTPGARYFHNNLTEMAIGEQAALEHYRIQNESRAAHHLSSLYIAQEKDSRYQGVSLAFGAKWSRTEYNVSFKGENADCQLSGLYTVGDSQLNDFHLDIQHSVPGCSSSEQFKGILYGKGRGVFDGRVLVDQYAQKTEAHLTNNNLLLTREAEIDTKPQLEIYADDVKCSHGTTVGQIEPEQVFYLRSRGIDPVTAHKMLSMGFAEEVLAQISLPSLRAYAGEKLTAALDTVPESAIKG